MTSRIQLGNDDFPREGATSPDPLPCGAKSSWDNTGWRCHKCFAIFGSIGCPCNELEGEDEGGHEEAR